MMTDPSSAARVSKIARVRGLTDPLGAMGQRKTRDRVLREAGARRAVFVAAIASFVAAFGMIVGSFPEQPVSGQPVAQVGQVASRSDLVVAPDRQARTPRPHVRTRSSPR